MKKTLADIRGDEIGKRMNDWYTWAICPVCGKGRWIIRFKLKLKQFTGLCQHCNAIKRHPCMVRGSNHHWWNGGQTVYRGYVYIATEEHPSRDSRGYVKRARLVLEESLGRYLLTNCIPHHINGNKGDDRPSNLLEMTRSQHQSLHSRERWLAIKAKSQVDTGR